MSGPKKGKGKAAASPFAKLEGLRSQLLAKEGAKGKAAGRSTPATPRSPGAAKASPHGRAIAHGAASPPATQADDDLAFHRLVAGVTPLAEEGRRRVPKAAPPPTEEGDRRRAGGAEAAAIAAAEDAAVHEHLRALVEGGTARFEVVDDGHRVEGRRVEVPAATMRSLRRGLLPVDARLDLHGLHADEAQGALEAFVRDARVRSERCVLVVHGKGHHSPRGVGVLRGEMAAWLSQGRASEHVAAFATSDPSDGGGGALYVLLRR